MSPVTLFLTGLGTGLLAGGASCAAVQGGLLAGAVTRRTASHPQSPASGSPALLPVGVFLAGKLVSHTALGAVLGAFGSVLQPSPRVRAVILVAAAVLMVFFALELLGLRAAKRWSPRPPVAWMRLVRRGSMSTWALTPMLLGLATILLPCGVTLSMELVAVTSASPFTGAAVMAGFVLGTAPLFTVLGYLLRQSTKILQGRLRFATGAAVLVVAVFTALSGIRLGGWTAPSADTASNPIPAAAVPLPAPGDAKPQVITLRADNDSYSPARITAQAGRPTTLVLRTKKTTGCPRAFVIPKLNIEKVLPKTGRTAIDLGTPTAGTLSYTCAMGMHGGVINFTAPPSTKTRAERPAAPQATS